MAIPAGHITNVREITTLQGHILQQQTQHPEATGTLSWILSALSISAKMIASQVRRARLEDVLGHAGAENVQGEQQQKLDVIANEILLRTLGGRMGVAIVASEENEEPVILRHDREAERRYCVLFDPLDGSSNLDVCGLVGTIFSILRQDRRAARAEDSLLQPGRDQVARRLHPLRTLNRICADHRRRCGSVRTGPCNWGSPPGGAGREDSSGSEELLGERGEAPGIPAGLPAIPGMGPGADLLQPLCRRHGCRRPPHPAQGRSFMYPPTHKAPKGKLRLMYEANPMAWLVEQAGGKALAAPGERILDVQPTDIHQRTPVIIGSPVEVDHVVSHLAPAPGEPRVA